MSKFERRAVLGMMASSAGGLASGVLARAGATPGRSAVYQLSAAFTPEDSLRSLAAVVVPRSAQPVIGPSLDRPIIAKWIYPDLFRMYHPMSLSNGRLYVGQSAGLVTVLDAATGEAVWSNQIGEFDAVSTPAVADGILFFSTTDRPGSTVQAVDADTGAEIWRFTPEIAGASDVAVGTGVIYVGVDGMLFAFEASTGNVRWQTVPANLGYGSQTVFAGDQVFVTNQDGYLLSVDAANGAERWRSFVGERIGAPMVTPDRVFISGGDEFHAYSALDGSPIWRQNLGAQPRFSSISEAGIYCDADNTMFALDTATGEIRWQFSSGLENIFDSLVVASRVVYLAGQNLYALNEADGSEYWRYPLNTESMLHSTMVTAGDGRVFFTNDVHNLYAIGNLDVPRIAVDVTLRGTPSSSGVERGIATAGDEIERLGSLSERDGTVWVEVTVGEVSGWIPYDSIDPASLPPEGDIEYVYVPG